MIKKKVPYEACKDESDEHGKTCCVEGHLVGLVTRKLGDTISRGGEVCNAVDHEP